MWYFSNLWESMKNSVNVFNPSSEDLQRMQDRMKKIEESPGYNANLGFWDTFNKSVTTVTDLASGKLETLKKNYAATGDPTIPAPDQTVNMMSFVGIGLIAMTVLLVFRK
jgi:hypothetical protein